MDVDDWPLTGDCGDTDASLPHVEPTPAGTRTMLELTLAAGMQYAPPRPNVFASGGQVFPMGRRPKLSLPFWGGTP